MDVMTVDSGAARRRLSHEEMRESLQAACPARGRWPKRNRELKLYRELMLRLLRMEPKILKQGDDAHVSFLDDTVSFMIRTPRDLGSASKMLDRLRYDPDLYDDGLDCQSIDQFFSGFLLFLVSGGIGTLYTLYVARKHPNFLGIPLRNYLEAAWAGGIGYIIAYFAATGDHAPKKKSQGIVRTTLLDMLTPVTGSLCGVIGLLGLRSGLINLRPQGVNSEVFDFMVCLGLGYAGLKRFSRFEFMKQIIGSERGR